MTEKKNQVELEKTEERRRRLKEKLWKAKASGNLTEDDEAEILRYALGVVTGRHDAPRD